MQIRAYDLIARRNKFVNKKSAHKPVNAEDENAPPH